MSGITPFKDESEVATQEQAAQGHLTPVSGWIWKKPIPLGQEAPKTLTEENVVEPDPMLLDVVQTVVDTQCPLDDIRNVIVKTAKYVARDGPEFEQCVLRTEDHTEFALTQQSL